ncbi:autotransporter outer membrane beta-barrel domain-containing protein [Citreicella sp. C3M06]|uniref:autotransporter outer membrane beta-barrel domain-containing protein n=1 Tax=Citreicella sp. C3M06 TaxID=2841564 RepID=UPI001C0A0C23|nr:autotransporter outer membrane beta-barrel domain-containing protein [Citreicella sp. C3M06]MBU2961457.1 autotransporter outer membrane beta-barrel domain-containing protein [Citreicella sp. C3M06]
MNRDIETPQNPAGVLLSWSSGIEAGTLDGVNSLDLGLSFDAGSFGINGEKGNFRYGVAARSLGAGGLDSAAALRSTDNGGHGGDGGSVTVDMRSGYISLNSPQAAGVVALSRGGAGGSAGRAEALLDSTSGGTGGTGGAGRTAEVTVRSQGISVIGDLAQGVVAQSSAGAGGNGGDVSSGGADNTAGNGGQGGEGGRAQAVVWSGPVDVSGRSALGIGSYSTGGDGGRGGTSAQSGQAVTGGQGGAGGSAGIAATNVDAVSVTASGEDAHAIVAYSKGGNGGDGGHSLLGLTTVTGGRGGDGGAGEYTSLTLNGGQALATGDGAVAVSAISQGGAGGTGGNAQDHYETDDLKTGATGGRGGTGASGGTVYVAIQDSDISASGTDAIGVEVRSIGGQGGAGGDGVAGGALANGGRGGAGGDGSDVELLLIGGEIKVDGDAAAAVLVQSQGGDGGAGGDASTIAGDVKGGLGGAGGAAGSVTVTTTSRTSITTTGSGAQHGILAESLAGQGGTGGGGSTGIGKGTGGDGGSAGSNAATVTASIDADITTVGDEAQGLVARSYGGAGGDGGDGVGVIGDGNGGAGGSSSAGGNVQLTFSGSIATAGDGAGAILAQSIGGFSGNAGASGGFLAYGAGSQSAGDGGIVTAAILSGAVLTTRGTDANAIMLQSIGGGGGVAGSSSGAGALGGTGSSGGDGSAVKLTTGDIQIETFGDSSRGISATSHGGGGGDGGGAGGIVSIGGASGSGGDGGTVEVETTAQIITHGDSADGLHAQSIGGGGGSADGTGGVVAVGGTGGGGGDSDAVSVLAGGSILTEGRDADGVFAQSIGGGGGDGAWATSPDGVASLAVGGQGGAGGDAGEVTFADVDPNAAAYLIQTTGERARGIFAQSIGGGGGDGGQALTVGDINIAVGGSGDAGGDGAAVDVTTGAHISTSGNLSTGISAQSVGGGGGSGGQSIEVANGPMTISVGVGGSGGSGGVGSTVNVDTSGNISTSGQIADAISAQSIGGGGGTSGQSLSVTGVTMGNVATTVGGAGGAGNHADAVSVSSSGTLTTEGDASNGIMAQSIGGGGGASKVAGTITAIGGTGSVSTTVGGQGGAAGDGGDVSVDADGSIVTAGDNSDGILASSIGGGGGSSAETYSITALTTASIQTTVGGSGGSSGSAGDVDVSSNAFIHTAGDQSAGIAAQSVAGSGGKSGTVLNGSLSVGAVNTTVGGSGGDGGVAGDVTLFNTGMIITEGSHSEAISAQSIGGGGGTAKGAITGAIGVGAIDVTFGGDGGNAGTAGDVSVTSEGDVLTLGAYSGGILAQSQGGAGGQGGLSIEGSLTAGEISGAANVTVGGGGGSGGAAGNTVVANSGDIQTLNYGSAAITAQSVGGNGGAAGNVITGNVNLSTEAGGEVNVDVGGPGGDGAVAGTVTVDNSGDLYTRSYNSTGIVAQSIGGNGGVGGSVYSVSGEIEKASSVAVGVDVGGDGGTGMDADDVAVTNAGTITTIGDGSAGIIAQSIGGGGGIAGNTANFDLDLTGLVKGSTVTVTSNIDVGGDGGAGGYGRAVTVQNSGNITTSGESASGIVAQSIGGGGGYGGSASSQSVNLGNLCKLSKLLAIYECGADGDTKVKVELSLEIGGSGGAGSDSDVVTVGNSADIATSGRLSHAIYAQSIGGGGGTGGEGDLGTNTWMTGDDDDDSVGAGVPSFLQSTSVDIAIGGTGGEAADGGAVSITNTGQLFTEGQSAYGVFAQSIGGGGGHGGAGSGGLLNIFTLGNSGSGGGDGAQVDVVNGGTIATTGSGGVGIFAQSLGGGGGAAGDIEKALTFDFLDLNIGAGVGIQENAGEGGDSGTVNVTSGWIWTTGEAAHGIVAQSTAGAGGISSISGALEGGPTTFAGSNGAKGSSGDVNVTVDGGITVTGEQAHGIFAQSASGGVVGSNAVDATDTSGDVTVTVDGNVAAMGEGGRAILAQSSSLSVENNGRVTIDIASEATVETAEDGAETIAIFDGKDNLITNKGTIVHAGIGTGAEDFVIRTNGIGALLVDNQGIIAGSVRSESSDDMQAAAITIQNAEDATFLFGSEISLGEGGSMTNAGFVGLGSTAAPSSTQFLGDYTQTGEGQLGITVIAAQEDGTAASADLLEIDGSADLAGSVKVNMDVGENPMGGAQTIDAFLTTTGELTDSGLSVESSVIGRYSLNWDTPNAVALDYELDFGAATALAAVHGSNESLSLHLQELYMAGAVSREALNTLANISDATTYRNAIASLGSGIYTDTQASSLRASLSFGDAMMSCSQRDGSYRFVRESECVWVHLGASDFTRDDNNEALGYDEVSYDISGGVQFALDNDWQLGGALSFNHRALSKGSLMSGEGNILQAGAVAKRQFGPASLAASLSVGYGAFDITRNLFNGETAKGEQDIWSISGQVRSEYLFEAQTWYAKPRIDLGVHVLRTGSVSETGAEGFNYLIDGATSTYFSLQPAVEFGREWINTAGTLFRPSMTFGVTRMIDAAGSDADMQFDASPAGTSNFSISDEFDEFSLDVGLGLKILSTDNFVMDAGVSGQFSENTRQVGIDFRLSKNF